MKQTQVQSSSLVKCFPINCCLLFKLSQWSRSLQQDVIESWKGALVCQLPFQQFLAQEDSIFEDFVAFTACLKCSWANTLFVCFISFLIWFVPLSCMVFFAVLSIGLCRQQGAGRISWSCWKLVEEIWWLWKCCCSPRREDQSRFWLESGLSLYKHKYRQYQ